ncbi:MAG TPA: DUF6089 family protein [Bacteroidales bacterium]
MPLEIRMNHYKSFFMGIERLKVLAAGILLLVFSLSSFSQPKTLEVGAAAGGMYYIGELNPYLPFNQTQLAYGALARLNLNYRWTVKLSYTRGKIKGNDMTTEAVTGRDLNVKTKINDYSLVAEFNFWEYFTGSKRNYMSPYLFAGVTYFTFKTADLNGVLLQPQGTEGQNIGFDGRSPYNQFGVAFPFGIGFKYSINERVGLALEWGMRKTFTDYLDDISTTYYFDAPAVSSPNETQLLSDPTMTHDTYMQRGNDGTNDWYSFAGLTVTYKINLINKRKCNLKGW